MFKKPIPRSCIGAITFLLACDLADETPSGETPIAEVTCETGQEHEFELGFLPDVSFTSIASAEFLEDGRIVVADAGEDAIFVFASGQLEKRFGRKGGGPGEFQSLASIRIKGDTIIAADRVSKRYSFFSTAGDLLREERLPEFLPLAGWAGPTAAGEYMISRHLNGSAPQVGFHVDTLELVRIQDNQGDIVDTIQGTTRYHDLRQGFSVFVVPTHPRGRIAALSDGFVIADGRGPIAIIADESHAFTAGPFQDVPSGAEFEQRARDAILRRSSSAVAASFADRLSDAPAAGTPGYDDVSTDREDFIWVSGFRFYGEPFTEYRVYDKAGNLVEHTTWPMYMEHLASNQSAAAFRVFGSAGEQGLRVYNRQCREAPAETMN